MSNMAIMELAMICSRCGTANPDAANYCMQCGGGLRAQTVHAVWRRPLLVLLLVVLTVVFFFTAFPQPAPGPFQVPGTAGSVAFGADPGVVLPMDVAGEDESRVRSGGDQMEHRQGTEVPVLVCTSDPSWMRPTPEEMAATVWQDNRYRDADGPYQGALAHYTAHVFLVPLVTGSGVSHLINMAGLGSALRTAVPPFDGGCGADPVRHERLNSQRELEIWLIGYETTGAQVTDEDRLVIGVRPQDSLNQGYQIVRVPRPDPVMLHVRFELPEGDLVAEAAGTRLFGPIDAPGWPPSP
jgi:hypothetical protein